MQDLPDPDLAASAAPVTAVTFPTSLSDLEAMAQPAVVCSLDGRILALSSTAIRLGASQRDKIVGRLVWEFAPGMEYLWDERVAAARAPDGATFDIAISIPSRRVALMIEYVMKVYELDGQPTVVAMITKARPLP